MILSRQPSPRGLPGHFCFRRNWRLDDYGVVRRFDSRPSRPIEAEAVQLENATAGESAGVCVEVHLKWSTPRDRASLLDRPDFICSTPAQKKEVCQAIITCRMMLVTAKMSGEPLFVQVHTLLILFISYEAVLLPSAVPMGSA